jgi:hypothetical protein
MNINSVGLVIFQKLRYFRPHFINELRFSLKKKKKKGPHLSTMNSEELAIWGETMDICVHGYKR